jgi:hypothetical protein
MGTRFQVHVRKGSIWLEGECVKEPLEFTRKFLNRAGRGGVLDTLRRTGVRDNHEKIADLVMKAKQHLSS